MASAAGVCVVSLSMWSGHQGNPPVRKGKLLAPPSDPSRGEKGWRPT